MKAKSWLLNLCLTGGILSFHSGLSARAGESDENFQYAVALMSERAEYGAAAEKFRDFADQNPQHFRAPEALFYLANCYAKLQKEQSAAETYEKIYRLYPAVGLAEKALAYGADAYFRAALYQRAITLYGELARRPASPLTITARYWRAESYARMLIAALADSVAADNDQIAEWYRAAQSDFSSFLQADPHQFTADALYSSGALAFDRRDYITAQARFARLLKDFPDYARREDTLYHLAESFYWQNNYTAALESFTALASQFPNGKYQSEIDAGRGWCAYSQQDFATAGKYFSTAAELAAAAEKRAQYHFSAGVAFEENNDLTTAAEQFARVLPTDSQYALALLRQGMIIRQQGGVDAAALKKVESFFARAAEVGGGAEALALLGETRLRLLNYPGAISAFTDCVTKFPDSSFVAFALYHRALCWSQTQQFAAALTDLQNLRRDFPTGEYRLLALNLIADDEKKSGNLPAAVNAWQKLTREADEASSDPKMATQAAELSSRALFNLGENTGDAAYFARLRSEFTNAAVGAMALIRLGEAAEKKNDLAAAVNFYEQAVQSAKKNEPNPEMCAVVQHGEYRLGVVAALLANQMAGQLSGIGNAKVEAIRSALAKLTAFRENYADDKSAELWRNRAVYYIAEMFYALGEKDAAAENYRICYETAPTDTLAPAALFGLAWVKNEAGDTAIATAAWRELLANFPQTEYRAETLYLLALDQQERGDFSVARQLIKELQTLEGNSERTLIEEAKIAEKSGDLSMAENILNPFVESASNRPERARALHSLSWLLWRQAEPLAQAALERENALKKSLNGRKIRDLPEAEQAAAIAQRDDWLQTRKMAREIENRMVVALEKLVGDYPDFAGRAAASLRLGEVFYERGDFTRAENYYRQVTDGGDSALFDKAYYRLGWSALKSSETDNVPTPKKNSLRQTALKNFNQVFAKFPDSPLASDAAWQAAEILRGDHDYTAALPIYRSLLNFAASAETRSGANYGYGICLLELQKYRDALTVFKEFLQKNTDASLWIPEANWGAGYAALMLGEYAAARDYFMAAKENNYGGEAAAKARFGLGVIEFEQGNFKVAREEFHKVEIFHPAWSEIAADALLKAAVCSRQLGETATAAKDLQRVLEKYAASAAALQARDLLAKNN